MNWLTRLNNNEKTRSKFIHFLSTYGLSGLEQAIDDYLSKQQIYVCKTNSSIVYIEISDIYFLDIQEHNIMIHTREACYQKCGSLSNELHRLSGYGFVKCHNSYLVSLSKIEHIGKDRITLNNGATLRMSRTFTKQVITAFYCYTPPKQDTT